MNKTDTQTNENDPINSVRVVDTGRFEDKRGFLHKVINQGLWQASPWEGEVYLVAAVPGEARGNHYHMNMGEWFSVVLGEGTLELLSPKSGLYRSIPLQADNPRSVYVPPGVAHALVNRGQDYMVTVACAERDDDPDDAFPVAIWYSN